MAPEKQFRAIVKGKVQGVFFRATTVEEALALGLAGYARNLPDGSVEVVARGDEKSLQKLIAFLRLGPRIAEVKSVDVDWSDTTPAPDPFTVRR